MKKDRELRKCIGASAGTYVKFEERMIMRQVPNHVQVELKALIQTAMKWARLAGYREGYLKALEEIKKMSEGDADEQI